MTRGVLLVALTLGLTAGSCSAMGEGDVAPALLLVGSFLLGFSAPQRAWRWGLLVGVCVPVAWFAWTTLFAWQAVTRPSPSAFSELASPLPAFLGAYVGVLLRWIAAHLGIESSVTRRG